MEYTLFVMEEGFENFSEEDELSNLMNNCSLSNSDITIDNIEIIYSDVLIKLVNKNGLYIIVKTQKGIDASVLAKGQKFECYEMEQMENGVYKLVGIFKD